MIVVDKINELRLKQGEDIIVLCHPSTWQRLVGDEDEPEWLYTDIRVKQNELYFLDTKETIDHFRYSGIVNPDVLGGDSNVKIPPVLSTEQYTQSEYKPINGLINLG